MGGPRRRRQETSNATAAHPSPSMSAITTFPDASTKADMGVVSSASKIPVPLLRGGGVGEVRHGQYDTGGNGV